MKIPPLGIVPFALASLALLLNLSAVQTAKASSWLTNSALTIGRYRQTTTLLQSGKILVAGGTSNGVVTNSTELFDPTTGTWAPTGALNTPRSSHTTTLLQNGKVLAVGGASGSGASELSSAELYDPVSGVWTTTGSLATRRTGHAATLLRNGQVLVAGGSFK
jgi:hypothetical protein